MRYHSGELRPESSTRLKFPRKVSGFDALQRPFTHKGKIRRNARTITDLQQHQRCKASPWGQMETIKTTAVDTERANDKGTFYTPNPTFDPRPRLIKNPGTNNAQPRISTATMNPVLDPKQVVSWLRS